MGFEPTISLGERPQTYVLHRTDTGTGIISIYFPSIGTALLHKNDNYSLSAMHQTVGHSVQQQWYTVLRSWSYATTKRLRWSRGSVLAFDTQVRGFKLGRSSRIFKGK